MINQFFILLSDSALSLSDAFKALIGPALFFLGIGLAAKRMALFADIRSALAESYLNIKIMGFNALLVVPALVFGS